MEEELRSGLRQQFFHDASGHIRQPEIAALEAIGEFGMVDAHKVKNRGVQVVDLNGIFDGIIAEFIGLADRDSGLQAASCNPH